MLTTENFYQVLAMAQTSKFVRSVEISDDHMPCVILYTDCQLRDVRAFSFDAHQGSVLVFDKTFNLGPVYVTVSIYRNLALHRETTGNSPAFFGPTFVHGKSDTDTHNKFFAQLASKFQEQDFHQLRLGLAELLFQWGVTASLLVAPQDKFPSLRQ